MNPIYYDTETTSLAGMPVLIQYAIGEGPIILYEPWRKKISETLDLIKFFMEHDDGVVGFNLSFDHFMLCKLWNTFNLYSNHNHYPIDHIDELAVLEKQARDGKCLKPKACLDLFLHARKGPYQSTMDRHDIKIKKVPTALAFKVAEHLEKTIPLKDIYFARRKNKYENKWKVEDFKYADGTKNPEFKNIVLRFNASNALKALAIDALGIDKKDILLYGDITIDDRFIPNEKKGEEYQYAPFALAVGKPGQWNGAWPEKIIYHIEHWAENKLARKYAEDDVTYTRSLYHHFGDPPMNDVDSVLACLVATCRWKGYTIDRDKIKKLKQEAIEASQSAPTAPAEVRKYIYYHLSETERVVLLNSKLEESTGKVILEDIAKQTEQCECVTNTTLFQDHINDEQEEIEKKLLNSNCVKCNGIGIVPTKVAKLARKVLDARFASYDIKFYNKLLRAGRLHVDLKVIGALSGRMSGGGKLNVQNIKGTKEVRRCFPLAWPGYVFCGGDFDSFEVVIAEAMYSDPELRELLQTYIDCPFCESKGCKECEGTGKHRLTIHGLFATFMYPGTTYLDILKSKGTKDDKYFKGKRGVFTSLYGGTGFAMKQRIGISREVGDKAVESFQHRYKKVGENNRRIADMFQGMKQPGGIGSKVEWHQPADYIESLFGFKRYFTLENSICKALFNLAEKPPENWLKLKIKVTRRDREQTIAGAVRSALFAAAFNIQGQNTRAALNHRIQSSGAQLTKELQCELWKLQPSGIEDWIISCFNVHDEINTVINPNYIEQEKQIVDKFIEKRKKDVPLLSMTWKTHMNNWAEK